MPRLAATDRQDQDNEPPGQGASLARSVLRYAAVADAGVIVVAVLSGPAIGQVAATAIATIGTITLGAIGAVAIALRRRP